MVNTDGLNLNKRIDDLWEWFENNKFENKGNYPRNTNLAFEFYDWTEKMDNYELAECLKLTSDIEDIEEAALIANHARHLISTGIDKYLRG